METIVRFLKQPMQYIVIALGRLLPDTVKADAIFLKMFYFSKMHKRLNLRNPKTFNEKLQWLKLYDRKPIYTTMVDKYEAKKYVADIIGEEYIIPTLGVWDKFDDIDFDMLPQQFVLKTTHDSGGAFICRDKSLFNLDRAKKVLKHSLNRKYFLNTREWPYKNVKPRIIAEKYVEDKFCDKLENKASLTDYKFFCFNGTPKYVCVSQGMSFHKTATMSFVSMDWQFAQFGRSDYKPYDYLPEKPSKFDQMAEIARKLSEDLTFLRVDLYEVGQRIYFSELTFFPCSGVLPFTPKIWDEELGELIKIN